MWSGGLCLALTLATSAHAAAPPGDFNGDGLSDLAIGVPFEDLPGGGSLEAQGAADVVNGGASGLVLPAPAANAFSQDTPGLDGDGAELGDHFGLALGSGDFNGDGHADLVVGTPSESVRSDGAPNSIEGAVNVIYGSDSGLTTASDRFITQDTLGIAGDGAEDGDQFGRPLATGDFNADGRDDLVIGVPNEDVASGDNHLDGAVNVIYGSSRGLTPTGNRFLTQNTKGMAGDGAAFAQEFGESLASGDFNGDGTDDLAVGAPGQFANTLDGELNVLYGSAGKGLTTTGSQVFSQDTQGVADSGEPGDGFAQAVAAGDLNGDGRDDLAVGVPFEDLAPIGGGDEIHDAGLVHLLYGSDTGITATADAFVTQDLPDGIAGDGAEADDRFGFALAMGRFNAGSLDDLAVGSPQEGIFTTSQQASAGVVNVLYGRSQHGFAAPGDVFNEDAFTGGDGIEASDQLGSDLGAGRFNADTRSDLAIGVSAEDSAAGAVGVLYGGSGGIQTGGQYFRQGDTGLGSTEAGDFFGAALTP